MGELAYEAILEGEDVRVVMQPRWIRQVQRRLGFPFYSTRPEKGIQAEFSKRFW